MTGEKDLAVLLHSMQPSLVDGVFVFCTSQRSLASIADQALMVFREEEGLTYILPKQVAESASLSFASEWAMITLNVHSSLEAVGFLAKITEQLAAAGISVNAVSAYYHDHLFVPVYKRQEAMTILQAITKGQ